MDITIQSLVQSPYMRTMAVVPTKSEELVHGIHDHLPPLVRTDVRIPPVRNAGVAGKWMFNIPRRGLWNSAELIIRPRIAANATIASNLVENQRNIVSTFVEAVENIELFSKQRFIERIAPEAILSEMLHRSTKQEQWYQHTSLDRNPTTGVFGTVQVPFPSIASFDKIGGLTATSVGSKPHYIIPLPFSSFTSVKKNFQTLFIEPLSVVITTKAFGYFPVTGYDVELVCHYHSFHPNVETVIRNANYKQSIPATIPWHDWITFDHRLNATSKQIDYSLESDALISTILVCPQWQHIESGVKTLALYQNLYIVIRSLSEILFEGSVASLQHRHDLILDETDATTHMEPILDPAYQVYVPIHFGIRRDQERFTGGLALSSITNPVLSVYASEQVYRGSDTNLASDSFPSSAGVYAEFDVKIVAKRHFFLRIDSDTGVITRSIES